MSSHVNVLLVGAGPTAIEYGRVLNAMAVPFKAVGRGESSGLKFEQACGVKPVLGGLADYLAQHAVKADTAAIVALPIPQLSAIAKLLIKAGVGRILVEKPAGLTVSEIEATAEAADRTKAHVFVAFNRRFFASVVAAREMIAADGGATSFHFEFTEVESHKRAEIIPPVVLDRWFLANSTHVVDLAFFLGGDPVMAQGLVGGGLDWHRSGGVFAGHGRTEHGALFSWHADWLSAGRWSVDIRTSRRRIVLQPLEELAIQEKGSFAITRATIDDSLDKKFKPGLYRQVEAFFSAEPAAQGLPTLQAHAVRARRWFFPICPTGDDAPVSLLSAS